MIAATIPDYGEVIDAYCERVLTGDRVAGVWEVAAVKRHRADLDNANERGFYFDADIAQKNCAFFPACLRHSIGEWASEPFELSPWQAFCIWNIHGWRRADDKTRRFRKAYVTVARKNGKTTWAAGATTKVTIADTPTEPVALGFCAATKKEQAALLWKECKRMVEAAPWLQDLCKVMGGDNKTGGQIIVKDGPQKGAELICVGADSRRLDGLNPQIVVKDEIHEWMERHRGLHEKLSTGGGSRRQALEIIITTAGDDNSQIWEEEDEFASKVVLAGAEGHALDDSLFAFICRIDVEDDPLDPSVWPKANPNYGVSVKPRYLEAQAAEAALKPSAYNQFVRYHTNRRTASFDLAFPERLWKRGNVAFDEPQRGDLCYAAFDLSTTNDWSAVAAVFPQAWTDEDGEPRWRYVVKTKSWCCPGINSNIDYGRDPYRTWIANGLLEFQAGNEIIDRIPLKEHVLELLNTYDVRAIPFDKHSAAEIAADLLNSYGAPVVDFPQTYLRFTEPIDSFTQALTAGYISHGDDPVLNWQANNCQIVYDPRGRMMLNKGNRQSWKKIDAMVAVIMAYGHSITDDKTDVNSGVLVT